MHFDWDHIPRINSSRVFLRGITPADAAAVYEIYSDPEVMRYWGGPCMTHRSEAKEFLRGVIDDLQKHKCIQWGISERPGHGVIGTVAMFALDFFAGKSEIGFALARSHWGKGLMREALRALFAYAFNEMDVRRIEADVDPRNLRSITLLEDLGFKREGYLRERWLVDGVTQDSLFYGLLKKEWDHSPADYETILPASSRASFLEAFRGLVRRL
jgi:RimJ/RimL family protein N-acetyltransferase